MTRSERLFALIQALRRHRRPVTAQKLATELSVSVRTIYRDIGTLWRKVHRLPAKRVSGS